MKQNDESIRLYINRRFKSPSWGIKRYRKKEGKIMKKVLTIVTVLVLFGFMGIIVKQPHITPTYAKYVSGHEQPINMAGKVQITQEEQKELTHDEIVSLTDTFMELLVQEIDDHYRVEKFDTKEELLKAFTPYIKKEAVQPYIDFYYEEKEDGLYILPTETPPWFENKTEYDKETLDNGNVQVTQQNENALYGKYTIIIEFEYIDGTWKIANISE